MSQNRLNGFRLKFQSSYFGLTHSNLISARHHSTDRIYATGNLSSQENPRELAKIQRLPLEQIGIRAQPVNRQTNGLQENNKKTSRSESRKDRLCLSHREGIKTLRSSQKQLSSISIIRLEPANPIALRPDNKKSQMISSLVALGLKDSQRPEFLKMPSFMEIGPSNLREKFLTSFQRFPKKKANSTFRPTIARQKDIPQIDKYPKTSLILDRNQSEAKSSLDCFKRRGSKEALKDKIERIRLLYNRLDKRVTGADTTFVNSEVLKNFKTLLRY